MKGTVVRKVGRLLLHFMLQPQFLPRYVAHNGWKRRTPLELETPWFSYGAIDFLNHRLDRTLRVFEYGSGGSTLFCARRARSVYSVEDNPEWFGRVTQELMARKLTNVTLKLCPFDVRNPQTFADSDYLRAMPDEAFDVIIVDGSEEWIQVRPLCFRMAEAHVRPGGLIVLDDAWRYPDVRVANRARQVQTFQSVGPGRPGVTTTDIFLY